MGKFTQYLGKTEIVVDGKKYELDVKLKDTKTMLTAFKGKELTEEGIDKLTISFKEIMKRSYPEEPEEEMNAFVEKKFPTILQELAIAQNWINREDIKKPFRESEESQQSGKKT